MHTLAIGGMGLSGSTLCYNIFRVIRDNSDLNYEVIKLHEYNGFANGASTIFMVRDLRDTVSSMLRKDPDQWKGDVEKATEYQMRWYYDSWDGKQKDFVWKYEDYKANPYEYVKSATITLGMNLPMEFIKSIVDGCEGIKDMNIPSHQEIIENNEQAILWNETKMSKRHITNGGKIGGYKDYLTEEQIRFIESKYRYFFEEQNYELDYE
jgi:hypothetical protein